ncbi:molybdopterin-dependent oxidoreductase [Kitasatospora sp. CB02891]|uniref:molybdopterin-dependent oxidoreductase n=1 Tax=Kitasatospora sp. CB02891 TaxID=2020329 RepID=UPI001E51FB4A|nr:molybdopterin-dependent oxidoreductase [Kitasatospora sp. CB02891]
MSNEPTPSPPRPGHRLLRTAGAAATGLAAATAALGTGAMAAYATGAPSTPVIAVGSAAIDLTPTPLKEYAVRTFGARDKAVLLDGIHLTMALLAALAGLLAARRPLAGAAVLGAFGGLGAWAALSRPGAHAADCAPSAAAGLVGAATLLLLARSWRRTSPALPGPQPEPEQEGALPGPAPAVTSRRTVLAATAATFTAGALAGTAGRILTDRRLDVTAARDAVRLPAPAVPPAPPPPPSVHPNIPGLSPFTTPNGDFYRVDTALTLPRIDPRDWALRIHGLVDRPQLITFDQLLREPLEELDHTLSCVSNEVGGPYLGTTRWLGASLPTLLRRAGVRSGADQLVGRSQDGMTIGTPLESVLDGRRALLAVAMNGEALPLAHGFPCRSVVPGFYGYTSATKWLVDLEVTTFAAFDPYWVQRGWDRTGTVRTASRIDVPAPFAKVRAGNVDIAGTAWATHRGIAAVEVRIDQGPWRQAELAFDAGPDLWRQWSYRWADAPPGAHRIEVRATDAAGAVQPEQRATPFPAGATGWHSTVVTVT